MIDSAGEGRDYNFVEAVKWFVERADLVCFFFDPEKPGSRYCMRQLSLFVVVAVVCVQMVVVWVFVAVEIVFVFCYSLQLFV